MYIYNEILLSLFQIYRPMISEDLLKQVAMEQYESILKKETGVDRTELSVIADKLKLPHIQVISGMRRCGKSTFLRQIMHTFFKDKNFYYINFEDERFLNFKAEDFNRLYEILVELHGEHKTFFIDEIQNLQGFENFIRRFYDNGFKFFITGSNSKLLSKEIGSKLTGRYIASELKPFSFQEYLKFKGLLMAESDLFQTVKRAVIKKNFNEYLHHGGMPEYARFKDDEIIFRVYEDIVLKDIVARYKVENYRQLRELYQFLISNYAQRFSYNSLNKSSGFSSINSVIKYIGCLEQTYMIKLINKFDYSLRKQQANEKKLYVADNAFISKLSARLTTDYGWLLENLVFNSFSSGQDIYYFKQNSECDFITVKDKKVTGAIQVTWELNNHNRKRELAGLIEALDYFKLKYGLILTNEQEEEINSEGKKIIVKPVWKWLLQKNQL